MAWQEHEEGHFLNRR